MRWQPRVFGILFLAVLLFAANVPRLALAQPTVPLSEVEVLKREIQRLKERVEQLERSARSPATSQVQTPAALAPPPSGEREITLEKEHPLETLGLPKPELAGVRISGFFVGSANYNSKLQLVPEFAGDTPLAARPRATNFRFDQFNVGISKTLAPWLSAGASLEVERHSDQHSHALTFGGIPCISASFCFEVFGNEIAQTTIDLHGFHLTAIAPVGNGLALSFGRFDVPFGYERHDAPLNLTASNSELLRFGRPTSMTGFQASYQFAPWLDATAWLVNRWENDTTDDPALGILFDDVNRDKSVGGRLGFTPLDGEHYLNLGVGGWWGPEQAGDNAHPRRVVDLDVTWSPFRRLLLAGELVYGEESGVSFRRRGFPVAAPPAVNEDVSWLAFYVLAHYDVTPWLGVSMRYGRFDDRDGARTGIKQRLQSWTFTPILHLSRLIPDLRPMGVTYARTRHPLDWVDLRLEYRLNSSSKPVFSDAKSLTPIPEADHTSHQLQMQFVVNF